MCHLRLDQIQKKIVANFHQLKLGHFYNFDKGFDVAISKDENANPLIFVKGAQNFEIKGFIGAKEHKALQGIDPRLTDIIEYGFFTFVAKPVLLLLNYQFQLERVHHLLIYLSS